MHITTPILLLSATMAGFAPGCPLGHTGGTGGTGASGGTGGAGGGTTTCTPLVINDPSAPLTGYTEFLPEQKQNNPQAGEPSYVYLAAGSEAVVVRGPDVTGSGLFVLSSPSISLVGKRYFSADGYTVIANPQLRYDVAIDDFEYEVALSKVELCESAGHLESRFVFRGNPGASGVAFDISIGATAAGKTFGPSAPVTVEVR